MRRRTAVVLAIIAVALASSACGKKAKPKIAAAPHAKTREAAMSAKIGTTENGVASWYGYPYHGRRAANGEIYDMEKLTAAHRTLPFETWVDVENLSNEKHVTVRITDRGPFIDGRIIDLSKAAARQIDLLGPGISPVRIKVVTAPPREIVPPPPPPVVVATTPPQNVPLPAPRPPAPVLIESTDQFAVQIGAFRDKAHADQLRQQYEQLFGSARLVFHAPGVWRVLVGREPSMESANALLARILERTKPAFVVRLDEPVPTPSGAEAPSELKLTPQQLKQTTTAPNQQ
jgi:rare lipoprotein A